MRLAFILLLTGLILIYEGFPLFSQKRWKELLIVASLLMVSMYIFMGYSDFIPYIDLRKILEVGTAPIGNLINDLFS